MMKKTRTKMRAPVSRRVKEKRQMSLSIVGVEEELAESDWWSV